MNILLLRNITDSLCILSNNYTSETNSSYATDTDTFCKRYAIYWWLLIRFDPMVVKLFDIRWIIQTHSYISHIIQIYVNPLLRHTSLLSDCSVHWADFVDIFRTFKMLILVEESAFDAISIQWSCATVATFNRIIVLKILLVMKCNLEYS